jgi:hypothetical protein
MWHHGPEKATPWPFVGFNVSEADTAACSCQDVQRIGLRIRQTLLGVMGLLPEDISRIKPSNGVIICVPPVAVEAMTLKRE